MAVVSDSGPLIALERIQQLQLLPALFTRILIPPAVEKEVASQWKPCRLGVGPTSETNRDARSIRALDGGGRSTNLIPALRAWALPTSSFSGYFLNFTQG